MTKEQAIERLNKMIQINNGVIKEARKNGDIFAMQLTADLDTDSIAIETALSMLEEKEKNKKIKWKPIKDYDRKKYDWVLVKYFDGDYECVPEVAEKRSDDKWYTSEKQIPFEVKYFFDMQEISEEE